MVTFTDSQQKAITIHDRCISVNAGAGSGKTFILVQRFLALLEANPHWRLNQIVAITFTQKAASEMRDRVRTELLRRAELEDGKKWLERLNQIDSARIDTIHGLCAAILRANAAEAGIDPQFAIIEDFDAALLRQTAVEDALSELNAENHPALNLFLDYDGRLIRETMIAHLSAPLDLTLSPDALLADWQDRWRDDLRLWVKQLRADDVLSRALHWEPNFSAVDPSDKQAELWQTALPHLRVLVQQDEVDACLASFTALSKLERITQKGAERNWRSPQELETAKLYLNAIHKFAKDVMQQLGGGLDELDSRAAHQLSLWQSLLSRAQSTYQRLKDERSVLDFDDLEQLTSKILEVDQIASRYDGAEFQHVMVDEFQDTSAAQWAVIRRIASPARPGALFIVGDPKQSIYRFRGADPTVFEQAEQLITANGGISLTLDWSFRTHAPLLGGFNTLFSSILKHESAHPAARYQSPFGSPMHAARQAAPCNLPALELVLFEKAVADETNEDLNAEGIRSWEAQVLAERLVALVEEKRPIFDKSKQEIRPIQFGDIALLFRAMSHTPIYEEALRDAGIPYVITGGKGYFDRPEVWDCINLLAALYNPNDDLALASVLRSPMFGISDNALLALRFPFITGSPAPSSVPSLWSALQDVSLEMPDADQEPIRFARECLNGLHASAGHTGVTDLLQSALDQTGYLATLTALPDGARRRANVVKFMQRVSEIKVSGIALGSLTRYLRDISALELREGEAPLSSDGSVQLITIHGSKGLEFPAVVLVDAAYKGKSGGLGALFHDADLGWVCSGGGLAPAENEPSQPPYMYRRAKWLEEARDEAESRRLLYVAATRAQDLLIVSGSFKKDAKSRGTWVHWLYDTLIQQINLPEDMNPSHDIEANWGTWRLVMPSYTPSPESHAVKTQHTPPFTTPPRDTYAQQPPLLAPINITIRDTVRSLSATHIADLGSAVHGYDEYRPYYRKRWRQRVLRAEPHHIDSVAVHTRRISGRIVGDMVHKALRWRTAADQHPIDLEHLKAYAWELGILDEADQTTAAERALRLMQKVLSSDVEQWINSARQVYRELPFIFKADQCTIHGIIDVLIQREDGTWAIIDYKTTYVPMKDRQHERGTVLRQHAQGYTLQMGVYAAAACDLLEVDDIPVYIHYIRHEHTVQIPRAHWVQALEQLEDNIGSMITDESD